MLSRSASIAVATLSALMIWVSPAPACERHQQQTVSISEAAPAAPASQAVEPAESALLVTPAAAAMSVAENLGEETYEKRCLRLRNLQQALTQ